MSNEGVGDGNINSSICYSLHVAAINIRKYCTPKEQESFKQNN